MVERKRHWVTCHNGLTPRKTKEFSKSSCFFLILMVQKYAELETTIFIRSQSFASFQRTFLRFFEQDRTIGIKIFYWLLLHFKVRCMKIKYYTTTDAVGYGSHIYRVYQGTVLAWLPYHGAAYGFKPLKFEVFFSMISLRKVLNR